MKTKDFLINNFGISEKVYDFCENIYQNLQTEFKITDEIAEYNQAKVLYAMQKHRLSAGHFVFSSGYGYDDIGTEVIEKIYADVFESESALVRINLTSGTHSIAKALFACLNYGDELVYATGSPYDTLHRIIGILPQKSSLADRGISYKQVELLNDNKIDFEGLKNAISNKTKVVAIQRSRGYSFRKSFNIDEIKEIVDFVKNIDSNIICFLDNCYGEFVEKQEPTATGIDIMAGSLIKNPGGSIAQMGGYIAGREDLVLLASNEVFSPGLGGDTGAILSLAPNILQGFFMAPSIVANATKTAILAAAIFEKLGYETSPKYNEKRTDIPQAIKFKSESLLLSFVRGMQKAGPVDSFLHLEPYVLPGHFCPVIMAAGSFIQGSTIELGADGPLRDDFVAYLQGGASISHGKIGLMIALENMKII